MKKSLSRGKLIKDADKWFSIYIRLRDCNENGYVVCPLCGARIHWKKAQNMHFITRACYLYRYDEHNCYAGCKRCNVFLNGNYIAYTRFMQKKFGIEKVDEMIRKSKQIYKLSTPELVEIIEKYMLKSRILAKQKGLQI